MCPRAIVVIGVTPNDLAQMCFTGDHDTVETFSPDRADQSLDVRVLPWRSRRGRMIAYAHGAEALEEHPTVDGIAIPNEVSRRFRPRQSFRLLRDSTTPPGLHP